MSSRARHTLVLLAVLSAAGCLGAPPEESDQGAVDATAGDVVPARTAAELGALAGDPEAKVAACYAVLGEGWLRGTEVSPDVFLSSCASLALVVDRTILEPTYVDATTGQPRVLGHEAHLEAGPLGFDLSLDRVRLEETGREVWVGKVAGAPYDALRLAEARSRLQGVVGQPLLPLGVQYAAGDVPPAVPRDVTAEIARRTAESGLADARIATVLAVVTERERIGTLVAIRDGAASGGTQGVLVYYDAVGHYLDAVAWPTLMNLPVVSAAW